MADMIDVLNTTTGLINNMTAARNADKDAQKQQEYQLELMSQSDKYTKENVERAVAAQKELYEYTGFASKVRQMKEAGLNPGLIYGMGASGGGGVTGNTAAPAGPQGSAPNMAGFRQNAIAQQGMALQLQKLQSEIDVNKSIAEANRAEATMKSGVETEVKQAEIESIKTTIQNVATQTKSEELKQDGIRLENAFKKIDLKIADKTIEDKISAIQSDSDRAYYSMMSAVGEMKSSLAKGTIDVATINTAIEQYNANLKKTITDALLAQKNTQKSDAEISQIFNKIQQDWQTSQEDIRVKQAEANKVIKELNLGKEQEDQVLNMLGKMIPTMLIK